MPTHEAFKQRLREAYRRAGGQEAVEQRAAIAQTTLSYWAGPAKKLPPPDRLARLADACGVTVEWLLTGTERAGVIDQRLLTVALEEVERYLAGRPRGARPRRMIAADKAALVAKLYAHAVQRWSETGDKEIRELLANLLLHE
jgi:transcriptional regulator with XRE-family HTH domain